MKTFDDELNATASEYVNLCGESVRYVRGISPKGADIMNRALAGMTGNKIITMATFGTFEEGSDIEIRSIKAVIDREKNIELTGTQRTHGPDITAFVMNDSEYGIGSDEIDTGSNMLELAVRIGETVQLRRITEIISMDAGMMMARIR
jgi:hypothetical protein